MPATRPVEERFWEKVEKTPTCWLFQGATDGCGYGMLGAGPTSSKRMHKTHRLSWELHNGPIPAGLCVLHSCDTPACVRPDHLFLGTQKDNAEDKERKGRGNHATGEQHWTHQRPERLVRGRAHWTYQHPEKVARGSDSVHSKLTDAQVREIKKKYRTGAYRQCDLAKEYGVSQPTIGRATLRK